MESITFQIEQALYRLRLAKPTPGLWFGITATTLTQTLSQLETELIALQQSLNW